MVGNSIQTAQPMPIAQGLDPAAVNMARAIRTTESGGNYTAQGKSGEFGAYQFTQPTWQKLAGQYLGDPNADIKNPQNQDKVAYYAIKNLKDQGYKPEQVASWWNSGKFDPTGNVGVNSQGVSFDTPKYVQSVMDKYNQFKQGIQSGPTTPNASTVSQDTQQPQPDLLSRITGAVNTIFPGGKIGEAIGNILGQLSPGAQQLKQMAAQGDTGAQSALNSTFQGPTASQIAGDVGQIGLTAASLGLPEGLAARLGARAIPALGEGSGILGRLASNIGLGAGFGATGALAQGSTKASDIGQNAALGGVAGGVLGGLGEALTGATGALAARTPETQLGKQTAALKTLTNAFEDNRSMVRDATGNLVERTNPIKTIVEAKAVPSVVDGKVNADSTINTLDTLISKQEGKATQLIDALDKRTVTQEVPGQLTFDPVQGINPATTQVPDSIPLNTFKKNVKTSIASSDAFRATGTVESSQSKVDKIFADYQKTYGRTLKWSELNRIRTAMNKVYDPETRDVARAIGDAARSILYDQSGSPELKLVMQREGDLIKARNFAEKIHKTAVKGGRLGKYFADLGGGIVGSSLGAPLGPIGSGITALAGGATADRLLNAYQRNFFNPIGSKTGGVVNTFLRNRATQTATNVGKSALLTALSRNSAKQ